MLKHKHLSNNIKASRINFRQSPFIWFSFKLQRKTIFVAISKASKKELTLAACKPESEQEMIKCDCDLQYFEEAASFVREYLNAEVISVRVKMAAWIRLPHPAWNDRASRSHKKKTKKKRWKIEARNVLGKLLNAINPVNFSL